MKDMNPAAGDDTHHPDGAELNRVFDALRHPHRRRILLALDGHNPRTGDELTREELSDTGEDRNRLMTKLVHVHLPKLADAGYITWERDGHVIERGPNYGDIGPVITLLRNHQDELPAEWP